MVRNILFVCTGNTCRSPMAAALFLKLLEEREKGLSQKFQVLSAGIFAQDGLKASLEAIEAMKGESIDLSSHVSQMVYPDLVRDADLILTMTGKQKEILVDRFPEAEAKTFTLMEYAGMEGEVGDPFGLGQEEYLKTVAQLKRVLPAVIDCLLASEEKEREGDQDEGSHRQ
ncbi:protein-tyrosine phosphatase [Thermosyntropha lipolytica DSM 11003]|uniref:Protein-tyrosine phosphatase n=1 Tax=Thermosyntropha lipolytica DSM 11003 TaxID=1123382 RepID=A0A1M5NV34_9FIRM|nr:low molecular weight protein arginine phosphatase [Thermosyntropha lipolytica]SHG93328.1 protein-tyrosine phosphatase [Thermosyntropha lipolytica DSM 11003]